MSEEWRLIAACKGMSADLWYPPELADLDDEVENKKRETPTLYAAGKRICMEQCPVQEECLEHALTNREPFGMWGGKTRPERNTILRQRRARARA